MPYFTEDIYHVAVDHAQKDHPAYGSRAGEC